MRVAVVEPGEHRRAVRVQRERVGTAQPLDVAVRADLEDLVGADGDRFRQLAAGPAREDLGVGDDQIDGAVFVGTLGPDHVPGDKGTDDDENDNEGRDPGCHACSTVERSPCGSRGGILTRRIACTVDQLMTPETPATGLRIAVVGAGAVGGYYGAMLARAGHDVGFVARGAHGEAIRGKGLTIRRFDGEFTVKAAATPNPAELGPADLVLLAVKNYDNDTALPLLRPLVGPGTTVLTLQNGVDSPDEAAAVVGRDAVLGGAAYIATAIAEPGVIEQTGSYQRIAFGEVFAPGPRISDRVARIAKVLDGAGIEALPAADGRVQLWEKFIYLAAMSGMTGAARQPLGVVRGDPVTRRRLFAAIREVEAVARAEGVPVALDIVNRLSVFVDGVPASMRSSLLIDLSAGRRIEVEALQGSVVRRAARLGVPVPIMETLYAVLRAAAASPAQ